MWIRTRKDEILNLDYFDTVSIDDNAIWAVRVGSRRPLLVRTDAETAQRIFDRIAQAMACGARYLNLAEAGLPFGPEDGDAS